ncbi:MAG TPA: hypothetical protein PKW15_04700 [Alphaproteobacteria bacterium]|nr:hypothetical protein [Alphaproteobacteria bacterium]
MHDIQDLERDADALFRRGADPAVREQFFHLVMIKCCAYFGTDYFIHYTPINEMIMQSSEADAATDSF